MRKAISRFAAVLPALITALSLAPALSGEADAGTLSYRKGSYGGYRNYGGCKPWNGYRRYGGYGRGSVFYFGTSPYYGYRYGRDRYGTRYRYEKRYAAPVVQGYTIPSTPAPATSAVSSPTPAPASEGGWQLLEAGRAEAAAAAFAREALGKPGDPSARIGYALAKGEAGDLAQSAWVLRRAFAEDGEIPRLDAYGAGLRDLARELIVRFDAYTPASYSDHGDAEFAKTALAYLAGDPDVPRPR